MVSLAWPRWPPMLSAWPLIPVMIMTTIPTPTATISNQHECRAEPARHPPCVKPANQLRCNGGNHRGGDHGRDDHLGEGGERHQAQEQHRHANQQPRHEPRVAQPPGHREDAGQLARVDVDVLIFAVHGALVVPVASQPPAHDRHRHADATPVRGQHAARTSGMITPWPTSPSGAASPGSATRAWSSSSARARLLTDPLLRSRVAFLRRHGPPAELPEGVDAVLLSHMHRDHADLPSLRRLPSGTLVIAPAGSGAVLRGLNVREVDVGETVEVAGVDDLCGPRRSRRAPATPEVAPCPPSASSRTASTSPATRTCSRGWPTSARWPPALLPIWGWGPALGPGHLDPEEAARALSLLNPELVVPIHWGTLLAAGFGRRHAHLLRKPVDDFLRHAGRLAPDVEVRVPRWASRSTSRPPLAASTCERIGRVKLPPLLKERPQGLQVLLGIVVPVVYGALTGWFLGKSEGVYAVLSVLAAIGGIGAGFDHHGAAAGARRGALGGVLFGAALLSDTRSRAATRRRSSRAPGSCSSSSPSSSASPSAPWAAAASAGARRLS